MKCFARLGVFALAVMPLLTSSRAAADAALDSLVASERAFAAMASTQGTKEAFLFYLAEDAVVFQPTATNGRQAWEARPANKATLLWEPAYAEVSSSGDLGYTTGPWEWHPPADSSGAPPPAERFAYGHFNSVWRKNKHDGWRVVADIGISHPKPDRGVGSGEFTPGPTLPIRTMKSARTKLADLDGKLSKAMRAQGLREGLAAHSAIDLRLNVEGRMPTLGIDAAQAQLDTLKGYLDYHQQGGGVARSGDLAYTYGWAERLVSGNAAPVDSSVYMNIWRQDKAHTWMLALVVLNPLRSK